MDKAAIFEEVTERDALRRGCGLPPLDVLVEYDHLVALAPWKEYAAVCDAHAQRRREIAEAVPAEYRAGRPPVWGASAGGRWRVEAVAQWRFERWLAALGHVEPPCPSKGIARYGADRPG